MHIKIDQSGKVEDTRVNTALAFSNGKRRSIFIDRREKRELQEIFRQNNKGHVFIFLNKKNYPGLNEYFSKRFYPLDPYSP